MFAVIANGKYIAFHEKKKVIERYAKLYKRTNQFDSVRLSKIDKTNDKYDEDLYLIPCNETYVQQRYYDIMVIESRYQEKLQLEKYLERLIFEDLSFKELKIIFDGLDVVRKKRKECGQYTPSVETLNTLYWMQEEYQNAMYYN